MVLIKLKIFSTDVNHIATAGIAEPYSYVIYSYKKKYFGLVYHRILTYFLNKQ